MKDGFGIAHIRSPSSRIAFDKLSDKREAMRLYLSAVGSNCREAATGCNVTLPPRA
jgi:hypothetical protein